MACKQNQTIMRLAKNIQSLAGTVVTAYEQEYEEIISSRCREKHRIEVIKSHKDALCNLLPGIRL